MSGPVMSELLFRHETAVDCFTETTSLTHEQLYGSVKMHPYTEDDDLEVFFLFPALLPSLHAQCSHSLYSYLD